MRVCLGGLERASCTCLTVRQRVEAAFDIRGNCRQVWQEYCDVLGDEGDATAALPGCSLTRTTET